MSECHELLVSVDVETSGPIPGNYSMLTIGACAIDDPTATFSCSLKPVAEGADPAAMAVTGLSLDKLRLTGFEPAAAMQAFENWLTGLSRGRDPPVFVGLNAPFDWSFVNYYFHRFTGSNPFGFTAVDIKAYYMGVTGCSWEETKSSAMAVRLKPMRSGTHDALQDALYQAELFRLIRDLAKARGVGEARG
jgi:ribonuclease T